MNCQEFLRNMEDPVAAGSMNADWLAHLSECPLCGQQQKIAAGLRALAAVERQREAPAAVEASLVAEFRKWAQHGRPVRLPRRAAAWRMRALLAAAAGLVLMASALWRVPGRPAPLPAAAVPAAVAADSDDEDAGGFIPLPNAEGLGPNDDINVVSVEVPRSAILAAGVPLGDERPSEMIEADVMLGPDGLARAIRVAN
jgi:hypothetical protein